MGTALQTRLDRVEFLKAVRRQDSRKTLTEALALEISETNKMRDFCNRIQLIVRKIRSPLSVRAAAKK